MSRLPEPLNGRLLAWGQGVCGRTILMCALLSVLTVGVYWPVILHNFTKFDDAAYVTNNLHVQRGLSWDGLTWAFGRLHGEQTYWHPLTWVSHMADCQVFGLKPAGHHFINLLFHTLNTVLVFLVFRRMTGSFWRCAVLAGLFALHPLQVDTVAWVAERKNLLSALFWLLTIWAYIRYVEKAVVSNQCLVTRSQASGVPGTDHGPRTTHYGSRITDHRSLFYLLSLCFFALGLMCKPVLVTLPFVLLLLDYWPLRRLGLNTQRSRLKTLLPLVREKVPFLVLAAVSSVVTLMSHHRIALLVSASSLPFEVRLENALVSYVRYLGKTIWPSNLAVFYPYSGPWPMWIAVACGLLLLAASGLAIHAARNRPYLLVGWFWFLGVLVPFIGLIQAGAQAMADRFAYVPLIGLFLTLVWGAHELAARWRCRAVALSAVALGAALVSAALTRRQIGYWKDDESLFRHALAVTSDNDLAHFNLGVTLADRGNFDEAIRHYEKAIRLNPARAEAHNSLAYALIRKHRFAEAVREYEAALRSNPVDAQVHNDLGVTLGRLGRVKEEIQHYSEALRLNASLPEVHYNLGLALAGRGRYPEAATQFREVLHLNPNHPNARQKLDLALISRDKFEKAVAPYRQVLLSTPGDARAHGSLGRVLLDAGQLDEALEQCAEAARLDPKNAEIQYHFGVALARTGDAEKAARQFELALELDPELAAAHYALGIICQQQRRMPEALEHWREAARLAPQWPDPFNNLAWTLATDPHAELRDGPEAVKLATQAAKLSGTNNVRVLDTLAAAYAESGRFAEATSTARAAQAAAETQALPGLADQIRDRLTLYGSNQPYREDPEVK
jgi:protein O-mannosyl-transferase